MTATTVPTLTLIRLCALQELRLSVRSRWTQTFALLFGVMAFTLDAGAAELLYSQPVSRPVILIGKLVGLGAALIASEAVGFGLAGLVLFDVAALGVASLLRSGTASRLLMVAAIVNPVDAVRTGTLLAVEGTTAFGAASLAFLRMTGGGADVAGTARRYLTLRPHEPGARGARERQEPCQPILDDPTHREGALIRIGFWIQRRRRVAGIDPARQVSDADVGKPRGLPDTAQAACPDTNPFPAR